MTTTNLGVVKAIFVGNSAPTNQDVIWRDTSLSTPLHKYYDTSSSSWQTLISSVQVDNVTIKIDVDGKIYVDPTSLPGYTLANGSVTLLKMADVATATVFYRKTAGTGIPEVQTLAVLKQDLGLIGINSGDQDLSGLALKTYQINGKALNGNITLTPSDIGSPSGSGNSTNTNTGDETESTIREKLGIENIVFPTVEDPTELATVTDLEGYVPVQTGYSLISDAQSAKLDALPDIKKIYLKDAATVSGRVALAVETTDYPTGWTLTASGYDLIVTHNLGREVGYIKVDEVNIVNKQQLIGSAAYAGIIGTLDNNSFTILGLATKKTDIKIHIFFD